MQLTNLNYWRNGIMKIKYFLVLILSAFVVTGCDDDDGSTASSVDCSMTGDLFTATQTAGGAWVEDITNKALCEAALASYQAFYDAGCDSDGTLGMAAAITSTTETCAGL